MRKIIILFLFMTMMFSIISCNKSYDAFDEMVNYLDNDDLNVHIMTQDELQRSLENVDRNGLVFEGGFTRGFYCRTPQGKFIQCFETEYVSDSTTLYDDLSSNSNYNTVISENIVIYGDSEIVNLLYDEFLKK